MEKKSVKLLELFNVEDSKYNDLVDLTVVKVDIYKAKASINLILEGIENLKDNRCLVAFVEELERDFGTRVNCAFKGVNRDNFPYLYEQLRGLIKHYIARDSSGGVSDMVDFINLSFDGDNETVNIDIPSGWSSMLSDSEKKDLKESVGDAINICVADRIGFNYEIVNSNPDVAGSDGAPVDDILKAIEEGRMEFPEEAPVEEKSGKGTGKKKTDKDKAPDAKPAGKDSWAAKAEQVRKEAKQEDKQSFYKAKENAENQLYGRVKKQATFMKIANLTVGCFDVNIAGNISFNDDSFKLAKTGKSVIVKFMCLDDTDGISCIAFLKPEEADGFQKEFGKGGFVGIQGNVENDSFTGDKTLRVSGFFSAEKPPKRKDNAERKRVVQSARE